MTLLNKNVTLLVNSSDDYSDAWVPFFTLLKKYWDITGIDIVLNTESKRINLSDFNIIFSHTNTKNYGIRMIKALKKIKTKYVVYMLEDYFLRSPVNNNTINKIIDFMDKNPKVVCFNSENGNNIYSNLKSNFEGYKIIPNGTKYILNLQACIWKRKSLLKYIKKNITPWEWELYTGILTFGKKDIFYCRDSAPLLFDYGHYLTSDLFGIFQGKWVISDVKPLFEKEKISVDYNLMGIFDKNCKRVYSPKFKSRHKFYFHHIYNRLGLKHVLIFFLIRKKLKKQKIDYFSFIQNKIDLQNQKCN